MSPRENPLKSLSFVLCTETAVRIDQTDKNGPIGVRVRPLLATPRGRQRPQRGRIQRRRARNHHPRPRRHRPLHLEFRLPQPRPQAEVGRPRRGHRRRGPHRLPRLVRHVRLQLGRVGRRGAFAAHVDDRQ